MSDNEKDTLAEDSQAFAENLDKILNEPLITKSAELSQQEVEQTKEEGAPAPSRRELLETSAKEKGWKPLKEYEEDGGDPLNWKDAGAFIKDGELIENVRNGRRKVDELEKKFSEMYSIMERSKQAEIEKTKKYYEAELARAEAEFNVKAIKENTAALARIEVEESSNKKQATQPSVTVDEKAARDFFERNKSWYNDDNPLMVTAVQMFNDQLVREQQVTGKPMSSQQVAEKIEEKIKKEFPHKFENQERSKPAKVLPPTGSPVHEKKSDLDLKSLVGKLTAHQKEVAMSACRLIDGYSIEQYAKDLYNLGELK
jgi:hypothetical protein